MRTTAAIRAASSLLLVLGAAGCGGGRARDELIVLDRSIGGVRLHELRANVERREGHGKVVATRDQRASEPPAHFEEVAYRDGELLVGFVSFTGRRARVVDALTRSGSFHTRSGVRVGGTLERVRAIGGIECQPMPGTCQHGFRRAGVPGTAFSIGATGKITRIAIATDAS